MDDRRGGGAVVGKDPRPLCGEGLTVGGIGGREGGHQVRLRVELLLEEDRQVVRLDCAQEHGFQGTKNAKGPPLGDPFAK